MVFAVPRYNSLISDVNFHSSLISKIREQIGPIATPKYVVCVEDLPKTRSGKLMRRLLRKLVDKWMGKEIELGDVSTLADPDVLTKIEKHLMATPKRL